MFFALKGDNFDGNSYAFEALQKGAKFCVVDDSNLDNENAFILVDDVLTTLQKIATFHRNYLGVTLLALTGSNGKTTTKELINSVLSTTYKISATKGNLNNHIGVPLTLLSMDSDTEIGIVEMGANHLKEIEQLCQIAQPNYGLITNFGKAHLEGFGSLEGVVQGKSELYAYLKNSGGTIFYNSDDSTQKKQAGSYKNTIVFNSESVSSYKIKLNESQPKINFSLNGAEVISTLSGTYNFNNILVALAVGSEFKVSEKNLIKGIELYHPDNNRSQWIEKNGTMFLMDAYNANPSSMEAALRNFASMDYKNKIVILGDMFELGPEALKEHQDITDLAESFQFKNLYVIGEHFYKINTKNDTTQKFKSFNEFVLNFKNLNLSKHQVMIKGSRGMALERLLS